jgi:hypothetical protein
MERHADDSPTVAPERQKLLARLRLEGGSVPDSDGLVCARGNQTVTVWAESYVKDVVQVAAEREDFATGRGVPELDSLIDTSGGQPPPVRTKGHGLKPTHVAAQAEKFLPRLGVPDFHLFVGGDVTKPGHCGQAFAVGAES